VHKIKIIDFGFALYKKELDMIPEEDKYAGTPGFAAPEILEGLEFD
jgi:serine/threonine protein kinase